MVRTAYLRVVNLTEALERARRQRMGLDPDGARNPREDAGSDPTVLGLGRRCPECQTEGFPEMVDLVRGTVDMTCPACEHVWEADRRLVPTIGDS